METVLQTPLGRIALALDGSPAAFAVSDYDEESDFARKHPVDVNKRICWRFEADGLQHILECSFKPSVPCESGPAGGERLEAIEVENEDVVLVVATEWDFEDNESDPHGEWDYTVAIVDEGLRFKFDEASRSRDIVIGVAWLTGYDDESRTNPWLLADPGMF